MKEEKQNETEIFVGKRVQWSGIYLLFSILLLFIEKVCLGCDSTNTGTSY